MQTGNYDALILGLSDAAFGFGSSQLEQLLVSLGERYAPAKIAAIEPDQKARPNRRGSLPFETMRIGSLLPPYDPVFLIEYNMAIYDQISEKKPDVIVASSGWVLPGVLRSKHRPRLFIYYMFESVEHQISALGADAIDFNRWAIASADLIIVPEKRRANADFRARGWHVEQALEVYNVSSSHQVMGADARNGKILCAGEVSYASMCDLMASEQVAKVQFDIAGSADTTEARALLASLLERPNIRYLGRVRNAELRSIRPHYAFSTVMWRPDSVSQLYAAPNAFFESIAAGVPPIVAPHPQCLEVLERYDCGIAMEDWTLTAFSAAIDDALKIYQTRHDRYTELVENCRRAYSAELNWQAQFEKIAARLPARL